MFVFFVSSKLVYSVERGPNAIPVFSKSLHRKKGYKPPEKNSLKIQLICKILYTL